jgi:hypothetical protein
MNGYCKVAVPIPFQPRVSHAIWKEKDIDLEYKLQLAINGQKARLKIKRSGHMMEFFLKKTIGLKELGAHIDE